MVMLPETNLCSSDLTTQQSPSEGTWIEYFLDPCLFLPPSPRALSSYKGATEIVLENTCKMRNATCPRMAEQPGTSPAPAQTLGIPSGCTSSLTNNVEPQRQTGALPHRSSVCKAFTAHQEEKRGCHTTPSLGLPTSPSLWCWKQCLARTSCSSTRHSWNCSCTFTLLGADERL